jgi:hypothetical protein
MHPFHAASGVISRVVCDQWQWAVAEGTTQYACFTQCPRDIAENCWLEHGGWTEKDYRINNVGYYAILPVACFELFFILCFGAYCLSGAELRLTPSRPAVPGRYPRFDVPNIRRQEIA